MSVILEAKDVNKTFRRGREATHALTSFSLTAVCLARTAPEKPRSCAC